MSHGATSNVYIVPAQPTSDDELSNYIREDYPSTVEEQINRVLLETTTVVDQWLDMPIVNALAVFLVLYLVHLVIRRIRNTRWR